MPDEPLLREKARAAVKNGTLPARRADRMWGGPGVGELCAVCERAITKDELEMEIQFAHDGSNPGLDRYPFHIRCFAAWELVRGKGS